MHEARYLEGRKQELFDKQTKVATKSQHYHKFRVTEDDVLPLTSY